MKISIWKSILLLAMAIPSTTLALVPGESIVLDQNTGDYIITYANPVGKLMQSHFVPSTKIDPSLHSRFENQNGAIHYRYTVCNGATSKQPLIGLTFDPVGSIASSTSIAKTSEEEYQAYIQQLSNPSRLAQMVIDNSRIIEAPNGWSCDVTPAGEKVWAGYRIACSFDNLDEGKRNGLQPGRCISGFGFYSSNLPGIGVAHLDGFGDMGPGFVDWGPSGEIAEQLEVLQLNDFVPRLAVVPAIAVPVPFDAAVLLDNIRAGVAIWTGKPIIDPAFASQLDRNLAAAAEAYRRNQPKAANEHIETLRELLRREHKDLDHDDEEDEEHEGKRSSKEKERKAGAQPFLIDRLAARVLDFDLRYVLKRTRKEGDKD